jgi:hypothetical protein
VFILENFKGGPVAPWTVKQGVYSESMGGQKSLL